MNLIIYAVVAIALIGAAAGFYGKIHHDGYEQGKAEVQAQFNKFKEDTAKLAAEQAEKARVQQQSDQLKKDTADAENKAAMARLNATIGELRHQRDSSRAAFLSSTAASPGSPQSTCFSTSELGAAYGRLVESVRGIADEGSKAVTDLDTAKKWANGRR